MLLRKTAACFAALVVLASFADPAKAQRQHLRNGIGPSVDFSQPFEDVASFQNDYQMFAFPEFGDFGNGPDPNTGWFGSYDRMYIYMSRPSDAPDATNQIQTDISTEGDFTWGNRWSYGYMTAEDRGWFGEFWHIDGPNVADIREVERVNILNEDDEINGDPDNVDLRGGGGGGGGGGGQMMMNQQRNGVPISDRNNPVSQDRRYFLQDTINQADLNSFELNRSWRLKQRFNGSYMEPFFGFRYIKYTDFHRRQSYNRIDDMGVVIPFVPPFTQDPTLLENEIYESLDSAFYNHMLGGQIGLRWYKFNQRWNVSTEIRAFMLNNFQFLETNQFTELTFYDGAAVGAMVEGVFVDRQRIQAEHATEFVFGGEVRAEAAYEVTRDINVKMGITFMEIGKGVGRGDSILGNAQNVTMFGITGGLVYRR